MHHASKRLKTDLPSRTHACTSACTQMGGSCFSLSAVDSRIASWLFHFAVRPLMFMQLCLMHQSVSVGAALADTSQVAFGSCVMVLCGVLCCRCTATFLLQMTIGCPLSADIQRVPGRYAGQCHCAAGGCLPHPGLAIQLSLFETSAP